MDDSTPKPRLIQPIPDDLIALIRSEISNTHVTERTTELEAGFMLGIQHALATLERHKHGGTI